MALQKQGINIPFGQGIDTKMDPNQVVAGKFLELDNAVFLKGGLLSKRNGFALISTTPENCNTLSTLSGNLIATGENLLAFNPTNNSWIDRGTIQPVTLSTINLVQTDNSPTSVSSALSPIKTICSAFNSLNGAYYVISDYATGQLLVGPITLPAGAFNPRVELVGNYFIIFYLVVVGAARHLRALPVSYATPAVVIAPLEMDASVSAPYVYDTAAANNKIYAVVSKPFGAVAIKSINNSLTVGFTFNTGTSADPISTVSLAINATGSTPQILVTRFGGTQVSYNLLDHDLNFIHADTHNLPSTVLISAAEFDGSKFIILYESPAAGSILASIAHSVHKLTVDAVSLVTTSDVLLKQNAGIYSKPFLSQGASLALLVSNSQYQNSYFLVDGNGNTLMRLAYENASGFLPYSSPITVLFDNNIFSIPFLNKSSIQAVNKSIATPVPGIFSQNSIKLAKMELSNLVQSSIEAAQSLLLSGGICWQFDGAYAVEQGFLLFPDGIEISSPVASPGLAVQQYFYQVCYEWTDLAGNIHRSAPSVPTSYNVTVTGYAASLVVPNLTFTQKTKNNSVRIVVYRWSTGQQVFYQLTSITAPYFNNATLPYTTIIDNASDASILGNNILYTTGGVLENIAPPATSALTVNKSRVFLINAESPNTLWYSKIILENTPIEFSDLQTITLSPSSSLAGRGPATAIAGMDDKLIIFKSDAIFYLVGSGPDATGNNNDFSDPIFVSSTVGSINQKSIVLTPTGLLFQSDKGIWRLRRDLGSDYIGSAVEAYNSDPVVSSLVLPGTNQVRFSLQSGIILMYDYFYDQWGTFSNLANSSSTLFQNLHTYINVHNQIFQETPDKYLDHTNPVLLSYKSAWIKLNGLQGYQRAYQISMLANYLTPHSLTFDIAYDYNVNMTQRAIVNPLNFNPMFGLAPGPYGSGAVYGGESNVEQWKISLQRQKCEAVQISMKEVYDASKGIVAGAGLTMSGLHFLLGVKAQEPKLSPKNSV